MSPVNDAPQIIDDIGTPDDPSDDVANVASISTPEDTPHAFTADDFNFADIDDGDALAVKSSPCRMPVCWPEWQSC